MNSSNDGIFSPLNFGSLTIPKSSFLTSSNVISLISLLGVAYGEPSGFLPVLLIVLSCNNTGTSSLVSTMFIATLLVMIALGFVYTSKKEN